MGNQRPAAKLQKLFPIKSLEDFLKAQDSLLNDKVLEDELVNTFKLYVLFLLLLNLLFHYFLFRLLSYIPAEAPSPRVSETHAT